MGLQKPRLDFYFKLALAAYTAAQLGSFAFTSASVPNNPELQEAMAWTRELGLGMDQVFPAMFASACGVVLAFVLVFAVQETVEWRRFLNPDSMCWQCLWLSISFFAQTVATAGFVPITRTLARSGDCTHDAATGLYWLDALNGTEAAPVPESSKLRCFTVEHWMRYAGPGLLLFTLFVALSARLMRAGGELGQLEFSWTSPCSWAGDGKKADTYRHPLCARDSTHEMLTVATKCVAVLASTFLGSIYPTVVAIVFVAMGMMMLGVTLWVPPYFGEAGGSPAVKSCADRARVLRSRANRLRCAVDVALLWTFACMLAACLVQRKGADSSVMLRVLPACTAVFLAGGYFLPSFVRCCHRRQAGVPHQPAGGREGEDEGAYEHKSPQSRWRGCGRCWRRQQVGAVQRGQVYQRV